MKRGGNSNETEPQGWRGSSLSQESLERFYKRRLQLSGCLFCGKERSTYASFPKPKYYKSHQIYMIEKQYQIGLCVGDTCQILLQKLWKSAEDLCCAYNSMIYPTEKEFRLCSVNLPTETQGIICDLILGIFTSYGCKADLEDRQILMRRLIGCLKIERQVEKDPKKTLPHMLIDLPGEHLDPVLDWWNNHNN